MNTAKGIIYCRVSSHEQVQGTSLDNQKRACLEYATNKGIEVKEVFIEKGESATAANRTEFLKALDYCKNSENGVSAFIVWKIDRFARNTTDHFAVRAKLTQYGATLQSVTEPITQDHIGKLMETFLAGYAEFENEVRKQRCEGGMQRRIIEGVRPWQPPLGYIHSKRRQDRRKTLPDEPDPERFHTIQRGLRAYAAGNYTITSLTQLFNTWGLKTKTGKPMRKQLVERILKEKFYAGININPWTGEDHLGLHQRMITIEEYNQIQVVKAGLSNHANNKRLHNHPDFPLRRFIDCTCGRKFTAAWHTGRNKKYAYYHCNNDQCEYYSQNISKKDLEDKFIDLLESITPKNDFLAAFEASVINKWQEKYSNFKEERRFYDRKLEQLETKKVELKNMRLNKEIDSKEFMELKNTLDNEMTSFQISSNEVKIEEFDLEANLIYAKQYISNLARQWQDMRDVKQKQRFQKLVLPEGITYDKAAENFGTAVLSCIFELNRLFIANPSDLVAGVGFEPTTSRL